MFLALNFCVQTNQLKFYPQDAATNFLMPNTMVDEDFFSCVGWSHGILPKAIINF